MRRAEKRYYQFTGCPARCDCGRRCGWSPAGRDPKPRLVRLGVTSGSLGGRINGYQRDGAEYFDRVGVIGVRHLHPSVGRSANLADEAHEIELYRPPFNEQHNPERGTAAQQSKQADILGRPVRWLTRAEMRADRARRFAVIAAGYAAAAGLGAVAAAVALLVALT